MASKLLITALCTGGLMLSGIQTMAQESPIDTVAAAADNAVTNKDEKKKTTEVAENNKKNLRNADDVICKKSVKTSTRLRRSKICKTRAKWDEERVATSKQLNEIRSQTRVDRYD